MRLSKELESATKYMNEATDNNMILTYEDAMAKLANAAELRDMKA